MGHTSLDTYEQRVERRHGAGAVPLDSRFPLVYIHY
jgi:hypothetical protein